MAETRNPKPEKTDPPDPNATLPLMPGENPDTSYMVIPRTKTSPKAVVVPVTGEKPSSAPPGKTGLEFSDEAPPGQAPVSVASDLTRELPGEGRISRVAAPIVAPIAAPAPVRQEAQEKPLRSMDLPKSKGIRITMPEAANPGCAEGRADGDGRRAVFPTMRPRHPVHKAAPHPSKPGAAAASPLPRRRSPSRGSPSAVVDQYPALVKRDVVAARFIRRLPPRRSTALLAVPPRGYGSASRRSGRAPRKRPSRHR